ncbi:MAG TPA: FecR domain-containing protein [Aquabacterium sp.]|uniref:FecR family protein n=1 Tax=Aquabacterium sp. TaxID=1872578 RepID=UPI002D8E5400|nr:FecR domain-containing protein [Aquabacterium sp.]HET6787266.1 FecR domain-containing protein [Aquabacterium sp.]HEX5373141.1 FecR domain-containing protein [Aquabacterium sp.]
MKSAICAALAMAVWCAPATAASASDTIGHIQTVAGVATVQRSGAALPATSGMALQRGDRVRTGQPGALGIVLTDDTTVSLGPNSELLLSQYDFEPKDKQFALVLKMLKGTFSYISGQIVKLAPGSAQLQTPDATIAVRGTKVLVQVQE